MRFQRLAAFVVLFLASTEQNGLQAQTEREEEQAHNARKVVSEQDAKNPAEEVNPSRGRRGSRSGRGRDTGGDTDARWPPRNGTANHFADELHASDAGKNKRKSTEIVLVGKNSVEEVLESGDSNDVGSGFGDQVPLENLTPSQRLAAIRSLLNARIVGQPEVVDVFVDIEERKAIAGPNRRTLPEIVYLMGLNGTGKDTSAMAYVDTINTKVGAHTKHMYTLPVAKKDADLWTFFGSNTGYIGSDDLSPFIKFLVEHSGGRYKILRDGEPGDKNRKEYVVQTKDWHAHMPLKDGVFSAEKAVVYVDEFHNWSKEAKDWFAKQAFEKGRFPINAPGQGLAEIYVPITFIVATNEGTELLAARNMYGLKVGKSQSHPELLTKWKRFHADKAALVKAIKSQRILQMGGQSQAGMSDELANRLPKRNLVLMRPLSPDDIRQIATLKVGALESRYARAAGDFGRIMLDLRDGIVEFVAQYQYDAEEGARPLDDKIKWLENTIQAAVFQYAENGTSGHRFIVDVKRNADRTYSLSFDYTAHNREGKSFELPIRETAHERPPERLSLERLNQLNSIAAEMQKRVFGIAPLAEKLQRAMTVSEERMHALDQDRDAEGSPARTFMFLGLSSTGKTETAKVMGDLSPGGKKSMLTQDFTSVKTVYDIKEKILGTRDELGRPKKSPFMEHFDKHGGKILFVPDEMSNASLDALKALYDIFREPVVTSFCDGEPRRMGGVTVAITGNTGEEWYKEIPRDIPKFMQMFAMAEVYEMAMKDPGYRRMILEKNFSEALINRIGESNIFFYPPLTFKALRELAMLKLDLALKDLQATASGWGWNIAFASSADYQKLLEIIETDGFVIREQGASIDRFVKQNFSEDLKALLLAEQITPDAKIAIVFDHSEENEREVRRSSHWKIHIEGRAEALDFRLDGLPDNKHIKQSKDGQILTAYHEVGHELVRHVLFGKKYRSTLISVIPGVAKISDDWVRYLGIAKSERLEYVDSTWDRVVAEIAVNLGGEAAESLVASQYTGGKSNDISRATAVARRAIIELGLSKRWGNYASGSDPDVFVASLSEEKRRLLEKEVETLLQAGKELARETILANYHSHFVPMSLELAERGEMRTEEIERHYADSAVVMPEKKSSLGRFINSYNPWQKGSWASSVLAKRHLSSDAELLPDTPRPETVADIDTLIAQRRQQQIAEVTPLPVPLVESFSVFPTLRGREVHGTAQPISDHEAFAAEGPDPIDGCEGGFDVIH